MPDQWCIAPFMTWVNPPSSQAFCKDVKTLRELEEVVAAAGGGAGLAACAEAVEKHMHEEPYPLEEVGCVLMCAGGTGCVGLDMAIVSPGDLGMGGAGYPTSAALC